MKNLLIALVIIMNIGAFIFGEEVRPVRDDIGFCWNAEGMNRLMEFLKSTEKEKFTLPGLVAGISAHDDYLYAGRIYYPLFKNIKAPEVVIFGVTHGTVRKEIGDPQGKLIFDEFSYWPSPFGKVEVSPLREYLKSKLDPALFLVNNKAHELEHSIEAMVPFLHYYNRDVRITPIMVAPMDFDTMKTISSRLSKVLMDYLKEKNLEIGKDIFFLISADANHYGKDFNNVIYGEDAEAHRKGTERDRKIAGTCLSGLMTDEKVHNLTGELWGVTYKDFKDTYWCGKYSIPFGLLTVIDLVRQLGKGKELTGEILRISDTYTGGVLPLTQTGMGITAPFSLKHWVSFLSAAFYLK